MIYVNILMCFDLNLKTKFGNIAILKHFHGFLLNIN